MRKMYSGGRFLIDSGEEVFDEWRLLIPSPPYRHPQNRVLNQAADAVNKDLTCLVSQVSAIQVFPQ
jgi:hypothetical protein